MPPLKVCFRRLPPCRLWRVCLSYVLEHVVGAETQRVFVDTEGAQAGQSWRRWALGLGWLRSLYGRLRDGAAVRVGCGIHSAFWNRSGDERLPLAEPAAALPPAETGCLAVDCSRRARPLVRLQAVVGRQRSNAEELADGGRPLARRARGRHGAGRIAGAALLEVAISRVL